MKTRPHWAMLVQLHWVVLWIVCLGFLWVLYHPHPVITMLHITTATPGVNFIELLFGKARPLATMMTLLVMFLVVAGPWTWWAITTYAITDGYLSWNVGPFSQNQIPLAKIQDTQMIRGTLALIFGYGTIMIDSGRAQIFLPFVPKPYEFRDNLQYRHPRESYASATQ